MQRDPLTRQQLGGHRLAQQRIPGPVGARRGVGSKQPGHRKLPQPPAHCVLVQPGDTAQRNLGHRHGRDGHQQHQRAIPAGGPGHQQVR